VSQKRQTKPKVTRKPQTPTIAAGEFKAICLELMDKVKERHAEYIVTKRGKPVAKLGPVDSVSPSPFGFLRGTVLDSRDIVKPDFEAWTESVSDPLAGG